MNFERHVVISRKAQTRLKSLLHYLLTSWSYKVKTDFINKLDHCINIISKNPEIFPESSKRKGLRKCVVTKQTAIYFNYDEKTVNIVMVYDTRQNPSKLDKEINDI